VERERERDCRVGERPLIVGELERLVEVLERLIGPEARLGGPELEQHCGALRGIGRFGQRAGEIGRGDVRSARSHRLAGRFAQGRHEAAVAGRPGREQVAGHVGARRADAGVQTRRLSVLLVALARIEAVVDGAAHERVHEGQRLAFAQHVDAPQRAGR
jgi:hypothetical protein